VLGFVQQGEVAGGNWVADLHMNLLSTVAYFGVNVNTDGTLVTGRDGEVLADMVGAGTELVAAAGGRGGLGNAALASSTTHTRGRNRRALAIRRFYRPGRRANPQLS